jgi:phosphohistidine phosphatase
MKVYLARHGEAVSSQVDAERPLSEQGRAGIRNVASYIKPLKISVEHIWHSGKLRAAQTAEILSDAMTVKNCSARKGLKPNDDVSIIAGELEAYNSDLMLVGHLPFLAYLASLLIADGDNISFDTGTIICFSRNNPGRWQIEWTISPRSRQVFSCR